MFVIYEHIFEKLRNFIKKGGSRTTALPITEVRENEVRIQNLNLKEGKLCRIEYVQWE
jgi:hypothetical protein